MSELQLIRADARHLPLADESVQCVVTSPPYWGLRRYSGSQEVDWGDWRGAFGLEPTIEMYVAHSLVILAELWRVLRPDGVVFWNIGDSYCANGKGGRDEECRSKGKNLPRGSSRWGGGNSEEPTLKPKDLCLIPERIALAAQQAGWWVRSRILWCKPNPMPESVTDRPTDAAEHIWMFTKSARYFWDAEAVRESASGNTHSRGNGDGGPKAQQRGSYKGWVDGTREVLTSRNMRNVWMFATQPYPDAHFATFPEELPRRCILAATSEKGACVQCGTPWERVTDNTPQTESWKGSNFDTGKTMEHQENRAQVRTNSAYERGSNPGRIALLRQQARENGGEYVNESHTIGWQPGCKCRRQHGRTRPCVVLDPFGGSGTVGRVAVEMNRSAVLIDLHYQSLQKRRTTEVQRSLVTA